MISDDVVERSWVRGIVKRGDNVVVVSYQLDRLFFRKKSLNQ